MGKTTIFMAVIDALKRAGVSVSGFYCPEVRAGGRRIGFKIIDIATGEEGWLARASRERCGIRVGRYCVNPADALRVGKSALSRAGEADVLAIDELGPMELRIGGLRDAIIDALRGSKAFVVVAHARLRDPGVTAALSGAEWLVVTESNRDVLRSELPMRVLTSLGCGKVG